MGTTNLAGAARTSDFRAGGGQSILVVDDEVIVRMLLVELLEEAGYTVVEAHDGASALRALEDAGAIDLLVTDVGLPGGMNGRQLAAAIRETHPELGVLFVTGYADMAADREDGTAPNTCVVAKPFKGDELLRRVVELLARRNGRSAGAADPAGAA